MIIEGVHRTTYSYSEPVFLEPHTLRLQPRSDPRQIVRSFSVRIDPKPDGATEGIDVYGNDVIWTWFSGQHESLEITTEFAVETLRENPFDFIVPSLEESALPPKYADADDEGLQPFLTPPIDESVRAFAAEVAEASGHQFVPFLRELTSRIHATHETIVRPEGEPLPAAETLASLRGSCRDLTVLFVEACRAIGIAARFVSGYFPLEEPGARDLHAWAGAYVPGAGWRGYDPTHGLAVSNRHVTLAAAADPVGAAPVDGNFRRTDARSLMDSQIDLRVVDPEQD